MRYPKHNDISFGLHYAKNVALRISIILSLISHFIASISWTFPFNRFACVCVCAVHNISNVGIVVHIFKRKKNQKQRTAWHFISHKNRFYLKPNALSIFCNGQWFHVYNIRYCKSAQILPGLNQMLDIFSDMNKTRWKLKIANPRIIQKQHQTTTNNNKNEKPANKQLPLTVTPLIRTSNTHQPNKL